MMRTSRCLGIYDVVSDSGEVYVTDRINKTCNCKGWFYTKHCKHLEALGIKKNVCND